MLGERIANLRKKRNLSQYELAERLGFSRGKLANYEQGSRQPDYDTLKKIADFFDESVEFLLYGERKQENNTKLTEKDEKDIAKRMEKMKKDLLEGSADGEGLNFMGEPMSEEAIESLLEALEHAERIATLANKKFTPKKYRDKE